MTRRGHCVLASQLTCSATSAPGADQELGMLLWRLNHTSDKGSVRFDLTRNAAQEIICYDNVSTCDMVLFGPNEASRPL
jgi:hypothetical protein